MPFYPGTPPIALPPHNPTSFEPHFSVFSSPSSSLPPPFMPGFHGPGFLPHSAFFSPPPSSLQPSHDFYLSFLPCPSPSRFLPAPLSPVVFTDTASLPPHSPSLSLWLSASPSWSTVFVPPSISGSEKASKPTSLSLPRRTLSREHSNPSTPKPKPSPSQPLESVPSAPTAKSASSSMEPPPNSPPADSKSFASTIL